MKFISKTKDRTLAATREQVHGVNWIILHERERYLPMGHARHKWSDTRITISREELQKLLEEIRFV